MTFFANLFRKATELGRLDLENARLISSLEKSEWKIDALEKEVKSERRSKDKILLRYADQLSRQAKLPEHFVSDAQPKEAPKVEPIPAHELERYEWAARNLRQIDRDSGMQNVPPLETYVEQIKQDPAAVFG